jgi:DNA recombination protein RmuC
MALFQALRGIFTEIQVDILPHNRYFNSTMNNETLEQLAIDPTSLAIGAGAGLVLGYLFSLGKTIRLEREKAALSARLESERAGLGDHFSALAQAALKSNTESFLTLAQEKLKAAQKDGVHDLEKRSIEIEKMVKPVEQHLHRMTSMVEELKATDKTIRDDLQYLHKETSKLTAALRNPAAQGKWGEFVLEMILQKANLQKGLHYDTQTAVDGGGRPDVIINLHDGFKIAIDSKAPINDLIARMDDEISEDERLSIRGNLARAVRGHVKALGARSYQESVKGCDFVILFLPSEMVFSATLQSDPSIVDYAAENNVVIASPTLIISLLRVVGLSWRQVKLAENAAEISALGAELYKRLSKFMEHFAKVGKNINTALGSYNDAVGSFDRQITPQAKKFKKYHVIPAGTELPPIGMLENTQRQITSISVEDDNEDLEEDQQAHG